MTRIIAVSLQKGGVGKTTTAQHLGHALAIQGRKVLLVDLDRQASLTARYTAEPEGTLSDVFGTTEHPATKALREIVMPTYQRNLYLAPASHELAKTDQLLAGGRGSEFKLDRMLRAEKLPFDYVVLDTAPGISTLLIAALVAADEIIIPVQLSPMGFEGFAAIDETIVEARDLQQVTGQVRLRYRAVVPTFYSQGQIVSDGFLEALRDAEHPDYKGQPIPLAPMPVPETTAFEQASMIDPRLGRGHTIFEMPSAEDSPISRGQAAYISLAEYVDAYPA